MKRRIFRTEYTCDGCGLVVPQEFSTDCDDVKPLVFDLPEGWRERRAHHVTHHACSPTCEAKVVASQHDREVYPRLVEPAMLFFPPGTTPGLREAVRKILAEG